MRYSNMKVLGLDPATSTGYCLVNIVGATADIYEYGYIDADISSEYQGDHCLDLMGRVQYLINIHHVDHIVIEDYFFSHKCRQGSNVNAAFRSALHILARQNNIPYTIVGVSAWKTFVAGRSTPTKEQKKRWGAAIAKKLYIQQALWERYSFRFPNHSLSETTGKPIVFRCDIIDVVGQTIYYCGMILRIRNISMSVKPPPDIVFKRKVKKLFVYDD